MIMGDGILASVVIGRTVGEVRAVVLEPVLYCSLILFHDSREHGNVATVEDYVMPVGFEAQFRLLVLGIDHQSARVTVEAVDDMSRTVLACLSEIVVEHGLDVERAVARSHREDAWLLIHDEEITVFVDDMNIAVLELHVLFRLADGDLHPRLQGIIELGDDLVVDLDAMPRERRLHLGATLLEMRQQPAEELGWLLNGVIVETLLGLLTDMIICSFVLHYSFLCQIEVILRWMAMMLQMLTKRNRQMPKMRAGSIVPPSRFGKSVEMTPI